MVAIKSQSMGLKFYNPNIKSTPMENALYASLSRPVFAMAAVSIVILISVSDQSGMEIKRLYFIDIYSLKTILFNKYFTLLYRISSQVFQATMGTASC